MGKVLSIIAVLFLFFSPQAMAYTFTDDFSGASINSAFWSIGFSNGNTVALDTVNQRVVMTQGSQFGSSGLGFDKFNISGNFDIRVDYAILNPPTATITQERIGLGASNSGAVERVSDGYFGGNVYLTDFQSMIGNASGIRPWPGIVTTDQSAQLRLTRDATGYTAYYWNGNWQTIKNWPTSTPNYYSGDVTFGFSIWNSYSTVANGMQVAFDNFYLDAPGWDGPPPPPGAVPEPATMLLLGSGLIGLAGYGRKKFRGK